MLSNMFSYLSFQKNYMEKKMIPITLKFSHITEKNSFFLKQINKRLLNDSNFKLLILTNSLLKIQMCEEITFH